MLGGDRWYVKFSQSKPNCIHAINTYPMNTLIFYIAKTQELYRFNLSSAYAYDSMTNLEMQSNKWKYKRFEILNKIIKDSQTLWILAFLNICQGSNLGSLKNQHWTHKTPPKTNTKWDRVCKGGGLTYIKWDMFISQTNFQFLKTVFIPFRPFFVIFPIPIIHRPNFIWNERTSWFHSPGRFVWVLKLLLEKHTLFTC